MNRFAEELLLLLLDEETGSLVPVPDRSLRYLLAGAVLMDLALENRIDTDLDRLILVDATPVGDDLLDPTLAEIAREQGTHNVDYWGERVAEHADAIREKAVARLVERGILELETDGFLSFSCLVARLRRYPSVDGKKEREAKLRIMGILFSDDIPSPRDIVIVGLANACGVFERILSREERAQVRERIELVSRMDLIGQSVAKAMRNAEQAPEPPARAAEHLLPRAPGLPIVGSVFGLMGNIREYLTEQYLELGPVFEVRALNRSFVVLAGIEANQFMARHGKTCLRSREFWMPFAEALGTTRLLINMDGSEHSKLRRVMQPGLSRARITNNLDHAADIVRREIDTWSPDAPFSGRHMFTSIVNEQLGLLCASSSPREYLDDLRTYFGALFLRIARIMPRIMLRTPRIKRARARVDEMLDKVLAAHQRDYPENGDADMVDDLLELHRTDPQFLPETDLKSAILAPFIAGLDTVPSTCCFMMYSLCKHPDLLARVKAEADTLFAQGLTMQNLRKMDVLHRVALETMRMYPVAPVANRHAANSFEFAGYRIPAGTNVVVATSVPHYLPEYFPNPEQFDIDRYTPERAEHRQPRAFAPFGVGAHHCLGDKFAEVQIALNIATILHKTELQLDPPDYQLKLKARPVLQPAGDFKFKLIRRRQGDECQTAS